jgi:hypothetical protein
MLNGNTTIDSGADIGILARNIDWSKPDLTIEGSGTLLINNDGWTGINSHGNVIINGGNVTITGNEAGIDSWDDTIISGDANVSINVGSYGLGPWGDIIISGDANVSIVAGEEGIWGTGSDVIIKDNAVVTIDSSDNAHVIRGINGVEISGSANVEIIGRGGLSSGIKAGAGGIIITTDGKVEVDANYYGIWADGGDITISGGMVTVTTGVIAASNIIITGGSINASPVFGTFLTNGAGQNVFLNTLTVTGQYSQAVTNATYGTSGTYGTNGVSTNATGQLFFYLPVSDGEERVDVTIGGAVYSATYERENNHDNEADLLCTCVNRKTTDCTECNNCPATGLPENCGNTCGSCVCSHDFNIPATCTEAAKCVCGATDGLPLGHDFGTSNNNGSHTCKRDGCVEAETCSPNTAGTTCTTCGYLSPTENNGGDTGDNGGDTGNNGGDTGDNGGDTGDNGGDTGNHGGDTGDNGGDTGNNGGDTGDNGDNNNGDNNNNNGNNNNNIGFIYNGRFVDMGPGSPRPPGGGGANPQPGERRFEIRITRT